MSNHDNACEVMLTPQDMNRLGLCLCKERALKARLAEKEMDSFALNAVRNALNRGASIRSRDLSKPVLTKIDERTIYGGLDINLPPEKPCLEGVFFYPLQEQRGESSAIDAARAADSAGEEHGSNN